MKNEGYHVIVEADLCRKAMESGLEMPDIAAGVVMACHSRAVLSLMDYLGLKAERVEDMRNNSTEEVLSRFGLSCSGTKDSAEKDIFRKKVEGFPVEDGTDAWYPVIDKNRCIECGKCHDFCLFGVYAVENKRVRVVRPQNCKNNCPACARL
ncbi:MAG: ferredoxin family protein, partial [Tannerellaceae bacterium]|nr:ferredoxin family protein [Tannerellaceae bacterium]